MSHGETEADYYRRRAVAENAAADQANDIRARAAHFELADLYDRRADDLDTISVV